MCGKVITRPRLVGTVAQTEIIHDLVDSDVGSVTDLDRDMSDKEDFVDSDVGSVTDLDKDMSDEEDCCDSDVTDLEWDTWADACSFRLSKCSGCISAGSG